MNTVEQYLEDVVLSNQDPRHDPRCHTAHHFVLFHGREFCSHPEPRKYFRKHGAGGQCFLNALKLVKKFPDDLTYAEGFAAAWFEGYYRPCFGLHAWAVTMEGEAVDPTWPGKVEYFGVPFDLDYVLKTKARRKEYGVIDNFQEDFPLLAGAEMDWRPEWDMARPFREGFIPYPKRQALFSHIAEVP